MANHKDKLFRYFRVVYMEMSSSAGIIFII
jgi:hypothetical protein